MSFYGRFNIKKLMFKDIIIVIIILIIIVIIIVTYFYIAPHPNNCSGAHMHRVRLR